MNIRICATCQTVFKLDNPRARNKYCSEKCRPPRKTVILEQTNCLICNNLYIPKYNCQKYCSKECRKIGFSKTKQEKAKPKKSFVCSFCNKEFTPSREYKNKFCSQKCYLDSKAEKWPVQKKHCIICDKEFEVPYRFREIMTCSQKCNRQRMCKPRITKQCEWCNKEFEIIETRQYFKYCSPKCRYAAAIKPECHQLYTITCQNCKKQIEVDYYSKNNKFCSLSCAKSGEFHPMYGKPGAMLGKIAWNHGLTAKTDERVKKLGKKISAIIADKLVSGSWDHQAGYQGEHYTGIKNGNKTVYLRSSYESAYARILDADQNVESWIHEPFRIEYEFEGLHKNYVPDFLVSLFDNEKQLLIEIKPAILTLNARNIAKAKAAIEYCDKHNYEFSIVTENDFEV